MPVRSLTIGERGVLRHAHARAIEICQRVIDSDDRRLGPLIARYMSARPTTDRLRVIRRDYQSIQAKLRTLSPESDTAFRRDEGNDCFAYVYADDDRTIYLGDDFSGATRRGLDSCAGTLIHETSHFRSVIGTDDYAYGEDVETLNFARGRRNADSYEYIAESFF